MRWLSLLTAGLVCVGCAPQLPVDPQPVPDESVRAAEAGAVLDVTPWSGRAPADSVVQSVTFATLDATDESVSSHALVISPTVQSNGRILVWEHGTTGIESSCSPSLLPGWLTDGGIPALDALLADGWTVVAPDYADPRTPRKMPYLVGDGQARATLDAVRATRALANGALSDDFVVWGHSQGGHAALWVAPTAQSYAPELEVDSVVAFAPAVDLEALLDPEGSAVAATIIGAWVAAGYDAWYGDDAASSSFAEPAADTMTDIAARCVFDSPYAAESQGLQRLDAGADEAGPVRMQPVFQERLRMNDPVGSSTVPVLVLWGEADEVIKPDTVRAWVDERTAAGDEVDGREYPGVDHSSVVAPGSPALEVAEEWTAQRAAGS